MSEPGQSVLIVGMHYAPETTGNAPYTTDLSKSLSAAGLAVDVITSHPHYPDWVVPPGYGAWIRKERLDGARVTRLKHYIPRNPNSAQRLLSELSFGLRACLTRWGKPDVILAVSPALLSTFCLAVRMKIERKRAFAVWVQDIYTLGLRETGTGGRMSSWIINRIERFVLRSADQVIVIHENFRGTILREFAICPEKVSVIRNWTHVNLGMSGTREEVRHRLGWTPTDFVAVHAGNQGLKQGLENLVEAARIADHLDSNVRIVLIGRGNQHSGLVRAAAGIKSIEFLDSLTDEDFGPTLLSADVLLVNELPDLSEMSVPSKLTTYFSTGLPTVAAVSADGATAAEIAASGAGVRVDPNDPAALVEVLHELDADPSLRNRLGEHGPIYMRDVLSRQTAVESFMRLLRLDRM